MTETNPKEMPSAAKILAALAKTGSDTSGVETFARYIWQAKQAVRQWLTCLSNNSGLAYVICEQVEDITLIYPSRIRFLQLKTRDRGSWSAVGMCDHGLDSLLRSYAQARKTELHHLATFELWMEGPIANAHETTVFTNDPTRASDEVRRKLLNNGAKLDWLDDFLSRLRINAKQPSQGHIDALAIREIQCIWPHLSKPELDLLYLRLLQAATAAQGAQSVNPIHLYLAAALDTSALSASWAEESSELWDPIRPQILSRPALEALTPPLPGEPADQVLARMAQGSSTSMLELKMTIAGAGKEAIRQAQAFRAEMEIKRQLLLASRQDAERDLERLAQRILTVANATARNIHLSSVANPVAASRPAEVIAAQLLSRPGELGSLDHQRLFDGDGLMLYGLLGHLSDLCRYSWQAS